MINLPNELSLILTTLSKTQEITVTAKPLLEAESEEYLAYRLSLNNKNALFRKAKITPKKIGQFVTLWKRPTAHDEIAPFDKTDEIEWIIINASEKNFTGYFIFNQELLFQKNIFSYDKKNGKRALRVYPPWSLPTSAQALKTQKWQLPFFIDLNQNETAVIEKVKKLFKKK